MYQYVFLIYLEQLVYLSVSEAAIELEFHGRRALQGRFQHFHVALLELVALVDRHADAWWDRKPLVGLGWSKCDVFVQCIHIFNM